MNSRYGPRAAVMIAAALAIGACDTIPTEPPRGWNTTWVVPGEEVTIEVDSLLPAAVQVAPDGSAFLVAIDGVDLSRRLGDMCAACDGIPDNTVLPVYPGFTDSLSATIPMPAEVVSFTLAGGGTDIEVTNGLTFDPMNPPGATTSGFMRTRIEAGATTLASVTIDGATTPFGPGTTLIRPLTFGAATAAGDLTVDFVLSSPSGSNVTVSPDDSVVVLVQPGEVQVSSVTVQVPAQSISSSTELEVDVDSTVIDHVKGGALRLHIDNDFALNGTFTVQFTGSGFAPIQRNFTINSGASTQTVSFNQDEMRTILGEPVTLTITGTVSSPSGEVTVTPGQALTIDSEVMLTVGPGEEEN